MTPTPARCWRRARASTSRGIRRSATSRSLVGKAGQQALVVDGKNVWPRAGLTKLHGEPVWSADGHGLAIVDEGAGAPRLVVMVEFDDPQGDLTWPVPRDALAPGLESSGPATVKS